MKPEFEHRHIDDVVFAMEGDLEALRMICAAIHMPERYNISFESAWDPDQNRPMWAAVIAQSGSQKEVRICYTFDDKPKLLAMLQCCEYSRAIASELATYLNPQDGPEGFFTTKPTHPGSQSRN